MKQWLLHADLHHRVIAIFEIAAEQVLVYTKHVIISLAFYIVTPLPVLSWSKALKNTAYLRTIVYNPENNKKSTPGLLNRVKAPIKKKI